MNIAKFKPLESDFDRRSAQRIISGRLTPKRYKTLMRSVRKFNYDHSAPYGTSPNGYPYSCGCSHDCCGCMTGESLDLDLTTIGVNRVQIKITYTIGFNY